MLTLELDLELEILTQGSTRLNQYATKDKALKGLNTLALGASPMKLE